MEPPPPPAVDNVCTPALVISSPGAATPTPAPTGWNEHPSRKLSAFTNTPSWHRTGTVEKPSVTLPSLAFSVMRSDEGARDTGNATYVARPADTEEIIGKSMGSSSPPAGAATPVGSAVMEGEGVVLRGGVPLGLGEVLREDVRVTEAVRVTLSVGDVLRVALPLGVGVRVALLLGVRVRVAVGVRVLVAVPVALFVSLGSAVCVLVPLGEAVPLREPDADPVPLRVLGPDAVLERVPLALAVPLLELVRELEYVPCGVTDAALE